MSSYELLIFFTVMLAATITPGPAMLYLMYCGWRRFSAPYTEMGGKLMTGALKIRSIQKAFNIFAGSFYCWFGFGLITDNK